MPARGPAQPGPGPCSPTRLREGPEHSQPGPVTHQAQEVVRSSTSKQLAPVSSVQCPVSGVRASPRSQGRGGGEEKARAPRGGASPGPPTCIWHSSPGSRSIPFSQAPGASGFSCLLGRVLPSSHPPLPRLCLRRAHCRPLPALQPALRRRHGHRLGAAVCSPPQPTLALVLASRGRTASQSCTRREGL